MTRYDVEHDIKRKNATTKIYTSLGISFHLLAFLALALLPRTIPQRELWSSTVTWTRSACGGPLGPWDERSYTKPFKVLKLTYTPQSWTFQAQKWMVCNCGGFSLSKWAFSGYMLNFRISQVIMLDPSRIDPMTSHCGQEIDGLLKEVPLTTWERCCPVQNQDINS